MKYLLVILFMSPEGNWSFVNGFLPRLVDTYEECELLRRSAEEYFSSLEGILDYGINCYERQPKGFNS